MPNIKIIMSTCLILSGTSIYTVITDINMDARLSCCLSICNRKYRTCCSYLIRTLYIIPSFNWLDFSSPLKYLTIS